MHTQTVGQLLKEERLKRQLSLDSLSKKTRIRTVYLEALEENDFSMLPAATFVKGYIKRYTGIIGLDYRPFLALLRRDFKESAKGQLVPREFIKPILKRRRSMTSVTAVAMVLGAVFLTFLGYIGVQWYYLYQPPELAITRPEDQSIVSPQVIVEGKTSTEAVVEVNDQPVALRPDGTFSSEVFLANEGVTTIKVEATDRRGKTNLIQRTVYVQF